MINTLVISCSVMAALKAVTNRVADRVCLEDWVPPGKDPDKLGSRSIKRLAR